MDRATLRDRPFGVAARFIGAALGTAALFFVFASQYRYGVDGPVTDAIDFRAFYCAGEALRSGHDPYLVEPMRTCEMRTLAEAGLRGGDRVLPAPFPPYALAAFAALSLLRIREATELWLACSVAALGCGIAILASLARVRPLLTAFALVLSVGSASLTFGQIVPIVFCAIVFAARQARLGDARGAAFGATIASIEPHVALPLWLGLAAGMPSSRRPLLIAAGVLCALSLCGGLPLVLEFATTTLPLHARSELHNFSTQYSLSSFLVAYGVPARVAQSAGLVDYVAMLAAGCYFGRRLAKRYDDPSLVVLAPVAAAVFGGEFVHVTQVALALPFALLLQRYLPRFATPRIALVVAIAVLAIPGESVAEFPAVWDRLPLHHAVAAPSIVPAGSPGESAEIPYGAYIDAFAERTDPRSVFEQTLWKFPTWLALAVVLAAGVRASFGFAPEREPSTALRSKPQRS